MPQAPHPLPETPRTEHARPPAYRAWGWGAAGAALLAAVFVLYSQPDFVVMLADQLWACF